MRIGEDCSLRRNEEVAVQREFETARDGRPIDRTDDNGVGRIPRPSRGGRVREPEISAGRPELVQVESGAERRIGSGQHDHPDVVTAGGLVHYFWQQPDHGCVQGVATMRPVEGDESDAALNCKQHTLVACRWVLHRLTQITRDLRPAQ